MVIHGTTDNASPTSDKPAILVDSAGRLITAGQTGSSANQVQGNIAAAATDSGNPVKVGGVYSAILPTLTDGQRGNLQLSITGRALSATGGSAAATDGFSNTLAFAAGATDSSSATTRLQGGAGYVFNGTTWDRARGDTSGAYAVAKPVTSGGLSAARVVTGTAGVLKASAGQLYKLHSVRNANASVRYLHLYDKATDPTLSTDTPALTISLAASSVQNAIDIGGDIGVAFANGIAWAFTTDNIAIPATAGTSTELMFSAAYK